MRLVLSLFRIFVSGALIYWILRSTNVTEIVTAVRTADLWLLVAAFLLHILGFTIGAIRWQLLLRARGINATIPFLLESTIVGVFFNNFLPSTIGGDVYRAYNTHQPGQSRANTLTVIFVDRFMGLLALMSLAMFALLSADEAAQNIPQLNVWLALGTVGLAAILWFMFRPPTRSTFIADLNIPMGSKIHAIMEAILAFRGQYAVLLKAFGLSLLLQINVVWHYYLVAQALKLPLSFFSLFLIVPLAIVVTLLPISVNGIGVRENVFAFFLAPLAIAKPEAVAFAWIIYGMVVLQGVMGGLVYALRR